MLRRKKLGTTFDPENIAEKRNCLKVSLERNTGEDCTKVGFKRWWTSEVYTGRLSVHFPSNPPSHAVVITN